jgi:hypothetical protein
MIADVRHAFQQGTITPDADKKTDVLQRAARLKGFNAKFLESGTSQVSVEVGRNDEINFPLGQNFKQSDDNRSRLAVEFFSMDSKTHVRVS